MVTPSEKIPCPKCGKPIAPSSTICVYCKALLTEDAEKIVCPRCGKPIDPAWVNCPSCHRSLTKAAHREKIIALVAIIVVLGCLYVFLLSPLGAPIGESVGICSNGHGIQGTFSDIHGESLILTAAGDYAYYNQGNPTEYGEYTRCGSKLELEEDGESTFSFKIADNGNLIEDIGGGEYFTWVQKS